MTSQLKIRIGILSATAILLLLPLIAMQFTNEVYWTSSDFLIMGILLLSLGFLVQWSLRKVKSLKYRLITLVLLFAIFLLIWVELAVGIFGTPFAGS